MIEEDEFRSNKKQRLPGRSLRKKGVFLTKWFEKAKAKVDDAKISVSQKMKEFEAVLDNLIEE